MVSFISNKVQSPKNSPGEIYRLKRKEREAKNVNARTSLVAMLPCLGGQVPLQGVQVQP